VIVRKMRQRHGKMVGNEPDSGVVRVSTLGAGDRAVLYDILAGHGMVGRLSALGFTPGVELTMVQNFGHGPVIVGVRGTRIALGRGEADKIRVRMVGDERQLSGV
jgi:Fe2+ transport system protein FeoA